MSSRHVLLTYRDYAALPADGRRYEIHDGELSVTAAPSPQHQMCSANLFTLLRSHVTAKHLGTVLYAPLDVILDDTTVVQPDLVYLAHERLSAISRRGIEGPPTLAVEILSPSTAAIDRGTKLRLYARQGVPFLWIVNPEAKAIDAYTLTSDRYALAIRAAGREPVDLPPFAGLALVPATLWP